MNGTTGSSTSKSSGSNNNNNKNGTSSSSPYDHASYWAAYNRLLQELLVIGVMPFLYGAATRLPFIYFVIHLDLYFHLSWATIGLYVAAYQGSRVITSGLAVIFPRLSHVCGTAVGLAGYITVFVSDNDLLTPFAVGTAIIGFSETMSSMQKYTKELYKFHPDRKKTKLMLKYQYALVMLGVMFAFSIGGFVYQYQGIDGVALFGALVEGGALAGVLLFLFMQWLLPEKTPPDFIDVHADANGDEEQQSHSHTNTNSQGQLTLINPHSNTAVGIYFDRTRSGRVKADDEVDVDALISGLLKIQAMNFDSLGSLKGSTHHRRTGLPSMPQIGEDSQHVDTQYNLDVGSNHQLNIDASMASLTLNELHALEASTQQFNMATGEKVTVEHLLHSANTKYATSHQVPATWVNWLLCLSFGIEALTIGYNLSIGPIFLLNQFNQDVGIIGILFAVGAASGSIAAIGITCTTCGQALMKKMIAKSPYDLCFAMFGIAVGVLVAAIPSFPIHVLGLILLMCFNDLGATLMTELQGSITTVNNYSLLGPLGQVVRRSLNVITALTGPVLFGIFPRLPYFVAGGVTLMWTIGLTIAFKIRRRMTLKAIEQRTGQAKELVKMEMSFATAEVVMSMLPVVMEQGKYSKMKDSQRRPPTTQEDAAQNGNDLDVSLFDASKHQPKPPTQQPSNSKLQQRQPSKQPSTQQPKRRQKLAMYDPNEEQPKQQQPKQQPLTMDDPDDEQHQHNNNSLNEIDV